MKVTDFQDGLARHLARVRKHRLSVPGRQPNKTWLIGEVKLTRSTLLEYKTKARKKEQLNAILKYAANHTYSRTAVFITFSGGKRRDANEARAHIRQKAVREGAFVIIVSPGSVRF